MLRRTNRIDEEVSFHAALPALELCHTLFGICCKAFLGVLTLEQLLL